MPPILTKKIVVGACAFALLIGIFGFFLYGLSPASADASAPSAVFEIKQGEGFREVMASLASAGLVRSPFAAETLSLLDGTAFHLQPGLYRVSAAMSPYAILGELAGRAPAEATVTIPEGENLYQIDAILANALVIRRGDLINFHGDGDLEGKLFPDTYRFYTGSNVSDVVQKMMDDWNAKAAPLLAKDKANTQRDLILASIVEKEVPDSNDQKIVAGILLKRLNDGMPLQVDATVCYAMQLADPLAASPCAALDLKVNSPYNTYLYTGFPPGPIGNPGISALQAALAPVSSPYWFYVSDPKTGKTVFAKTLDEQHQNTVKYLEGN